VAVGVSLTNDPAGTNEWGNSIACQVKKYSAASR